jgi:hypothetical protein
MWKSRCVREILVLTSLVATALFIGPSPALAADIALAWDKPADTDIAAYNIYYGKSGTNYQSAPALTVTSLDQTRCTVSGLEAGLTYSFSATSVDKAGQESLFSEEITFTVPTQLTTLCWDLPAGDADIAGYNIYFGEADTVYKTTPHYQITSAAKTSCTFSQLSSGVTYAFAATSIDAVGRESMFSEELFYTVPVNTGDDGQTDTGDDGTGDDGTGDTGGGTGDAGGTDPTSPGSGSGGADDNQDPADPSDNLPQLVCEAGEIRIDMNWTRISFTNSYEKPIVVATSLSRNDGDPAVVRVRNVTPSGFEIRVQEWDYLDGLHNLESVGYMVMEKGRYQLDNGKHVEAGHFYTRKSASISYTKAFSQPPVVLCGITTENDPTAVAGRVSSVSQTMFSFDLQEQQSNKGSHSTDETIGYIAWEPSSGVIGGRTYEVGLTGCEVTHNFHHIPFQTHFLNAPAFMAAMQTMNDTDPSNVRWRSKDAAGVNVKIEEETSRTASTRHKAEMVGYLAIE